MGSQSPGGSRRGNSSNSKVWGSARTVIVPGTAATGELFEKGVLDCIGVCKWCVSSSDFSPNRRWNDDAFVLGIPVSR